MKKISFIFSFICCILVAKAETTEKKFVYQGNPLVRHMYTADPTARVFNGRLYVYTSHDLSTADYYTMNDWHVFSTDDMVNWTDHGAFFGLNDIPWAESMAWAPDCVERDGKYYFYYPVERTKLGVAVSDNPTSGFKDSGKALVDNSTNPKLIGPEPIDPSVIVEDGQAYMFFGCREFRYAKLDDSMTKLKGGVKKVKLLGNEGDKEGYGGYYGEGPFVFKRNGIFYMLYSNGWASTSTLVYATAKNVAGPYTFQGEIMPSAGCETSHGSIVEFKGNWYLFYHTQDLSERKHRRSVCFDKLTFSEDGKINIVTQTRSALMQGEDFFTGKGRIAVSSDGNKHDNDDMQATMLTLMIFDKAKVHDHLSLYTYADHVWGSEENDLEIMKISAEVCGEKFGFDKTNFMAAVENPEKAYNAMRDEILKSTADNPLFIVAVGPMQVTGEALDRAMKINPDALNYVTVISHSVWNDTHSDNPHTAKNKGGAEPPHSGWTWKEMNDAFGERVNFNRTTDQNGTGTGNRPYHIRNKFSAPSWDSWDWMRTHANPNIQWLYEQARRNPAKPDFSDAGLAYYLVADLYGKRGDENGNPEKLRQWIGE